MTLRSGAVLALTAVLLLISGCASGTAVQPEITASPGAMSIEQSAALEDGVTHDEYLAGFDRYSACLEEEGFDIVISGEENSTIRYSVPGSAVDAGVDDRCYLGEFQQIDIAWQLSHEDTSEATRRLRECLERNGIAAEEKTEDVVRQLDDAGIDILSCE